MSLKVSMNQQNEALYKKLTDAGVEVDFGIDPAVPCWNVRESFRYKISSPDSIPNPEGMAHELLHIELLQKGFKGGYVIYSYFNEYNSLFTPDFIGGLNNDLAHYKMFNDFLKMGYSADAFLQDTPKAYFLGGMLLNVVGMVVLHKANVANVCEQTREMVLLCGQAKFFELYKIKDTTSVNGVHPDLIMGSLKEINKDLVEALEQLFVESHETTSLDNLLFFIKLDELLKKHGIPKAKDC